MAKYRKESQLFNFEESWQILFPLILISKLDLTKTSCDKTSDYQEYQAFCIQNVLNLT